MPCMMENIPPAVERAAYGKSTLNDVSTMLCLVLKEMRVYTPALYNKLLNQEDVLSMWWKRHQEEDVKRENSKKKKR